MTRPLPLLAAATALLFVAGCDEDSAGPQATTSTLTVSAYVDADGSGVLDAGDVPLEGATVTLTSGEGDVLSATTDSEGIAVFDAVPPGSYVVALDGDVPEGAVLATASEPIVVAPAFGAELESEFRFVFFAGEISGVIFRDDNASGAFEAGEDTPAPGIEVALFAGGQATGDPLRTAVTDAGGAFAFTTLRPGDYTLVVTPPETIEIVGGTTQTVSVPPEQDVVVPVLFTGNLVIPIAEAREKAGQTVTVEGVVTWQTQWDDRVYFFQDSTGGLSTFHFDAPELAMGDSIRVTGNVAAFQGEVQLDNIAAIEILANVGVPAPQPVSAADINAGEFQGVLVQVSGATVESVDVRSFDNQFVTLTDPEGGTFGVWADSRTGILPTEWVVGQRYDVTGVLGTDEREDLPHRLEPRMPSDVQEWQPLPLAEARLLPAGDTVVVEGVVTWQTQWDTRIYFLQDETGGISTFHSGAPDLEVGDSVALRGVLGAFQGEVQLSPVLALVVLGNVGEPAPIPVTADVINAGAFQGMLVQITGTVTEVEQVNDFGTHRVLLTDGAGDTFAVFVDNRTGVAMGDWTVGSSYTLTGVLGRDDRDELPFRLEIRTAADIQEN